MDDIRPYHRGLYRLPLTYPAMYCVTSTVGEGKITNLSAMGCSIETDEPLNQNQQVALRLLLPDQSESLPIDTAEVKWVQGTHAGIEFIQVESQPAPPCVRLGQDDRADPNPPATAHSFTLVFPPLACRFFRASPSRAARCRSTPIHGNDVRGRT